MTTRILVVNHGPGDVEVQTLTAPPKDGNWRITKADTLRPATQAEFYVHTGQRIEVVELER